MKRKDDIDGILCWNSFTFKDEYPTVDMGLNIKRVVRYIYYRLPAPIKKLLDPLSSKFEKRFDD